MKYIAMLAAAALAIVGLAYFVLFSTPAHQIVKDAEHDRAELKLQEPEPAQVPEDRSGEGTLENLRLLNEDLECTISYENSNDVGEVNGTFFTSDGDMRGDFLIELPEFSGQVLSSMIQKGDVMYVWSEIEGESYGVQFDLSDEEIDDQNTNLPIDSDVETKYDCKPWPNVDRTVFDPPADLLFQDAGLQQRAGMEYGTVYEEGEMMPEFP